MTLFKLACQLSWRNLWRNYRRTLIMLAAIVLGAWSMIFMTAMMRGMVDQMVEDGLEVLPGHVQVHHPDFRDDPSVLNTIPSPSPALEQALAGPDVVTWSTRVRVPAVITSERDTRGVILLGVDPVRERDLTFLAEDISQGRNLETADDKGLVIGKKLLERLETDIGKRVVVMTQDPDNNIAERGFRIVGVFDAELEAQEEGFLFAGLETVQGMLGIGTDSSELAVLGTDYNDVDDLYQRVSAATDDSLVVEPWYEVDTFLGSMRTMMDGFVVFMILIFFLALAFGLVNTLVMAVFERKREIGLMLALGVAPRNIVAQVVAEAVFLITLGLLLGNLASWATVAALKDGIDISGFAPEDIGMASRLFPALTTRDLLMANSIVLVLGFLASISPAVRASRLEPLEALRDT